MRPARPRSAGRGAAPEQTRGSPAAAYLLGAAGGAGVWLATAGYGPVVSWDSIAYLDFAANPGSDSPTMSFFCPLFPLLLTALGNFGLDGPAAARVLNATLFGATIVLAASAVRRYARWKWSPLFAALLVLTSRILLEQFSRVMSDPLALFLGFLGLCLAARFLEEPAWRWLVLSGTAVGLALLTRYSALPLAAAAGLALLARRGASWRARLLEAGAFAALATAPLALWMGRNIGATGSALNREVILRPPVPGVAVRFVHELSTWLLPSRSPASIRIALLAGAIAALGWLALRGRRPGAPGRSPLERLLLLFLPLYATFIAAVHLAVDSTIAAGTRHWLPVYFAMLLLGALFLDRAMSDPDRPGRRRRALAAAAAIFIAASGALAAGRGWLLFRNGAEFTSRAMANSVLHELAGPRWAGRPVYATDPEALLYVTGIQARRFPVKYFPMRRSPNGLYPSDLMRALDTLRSRGGLTARLAGGYSPRLPSVEELEQAANLVVVARDSTATIYAARP